MPSNISMIAACSKNRVIGKGNTLPWNIPEDMSHFVDVTKGQIVIMGRKTFESIGRPLPNRINVVLTRDFGFTAAGVVVIHHPDELEQALEDSGHVIQDKKRIVIGGGEVYRLFLPKAYRIYLTEVSTTIDGDAYFPELFDEWKEVSRYPGNNAANQVKYDFVVYHRLMNG